MQKGKQRFLSLFLVLTLIFSICPMELAITAPFENVWAAAVVASGSCGTDITWTITEDTEADWDLADSTGTPYKLTLSGSGEMKTFTSIARIPWINYSETITSILISEGITSISNYAFYNCASLPSVTLPDSLASIGDYAFANCNLLSSLTIPDNVTSIGQYAFYTNTSLKTVTLGKNTDSIGENAFSRSSLLANITFNSNLTSIGQTAFNNCSALTSIALPESLTFIGAGAFNGTSLTTVTIPKNVTSIGDGAFSDIATLTSITIDEENTSLRVIDSVLYQLKDGTPYILITCPQAAGITSLTVAEGTEIIGASAFYEYTSLKSVIFPETLKEIRNSAFYLTGLRSVIFPDSLETIGYKTFCACSSLTSVALGANLKNLDSLAFDVSTSINTITCSVENPYFDVVDNALYSEDHTIFYYYPTGRSDTEFHINNSVTRLAPYSFYSTKKLKELYLPVNLKTLDDSAICYNTNLISIYFYGNAPTSEYFSIQSRTNTLILYIPENAAGYTEGYWTNYTTTTWDYLNTLVDEGTAGDITWCFEGSMGRLTLTGAGNLPDYSMESPAPWNNYIHEIKTIEADALSGVGNYSFYQAQNLLRLTNNGNLSKAGNYAFTDCSDLFFLDTADLSSIGISAFENCSSLTDVTLSGKLTLLADNAFAGCSGISKLMIPDAVTSIGNNALKNCSSIRTINIPAAVTNIGTESFANMTALEKVYFYGTIPAAWENDSFNGSSLATLYYRTTQTDWNTLNGTWNTLPVIGLSKFYREAESHYSFTNSAESFGYNAAYRVPRQRYVDVLNSISTGTYYYAINQKWEGSCYGMAGTTLEFYENPDFNVADYDTQAQTVYDISAPQNAKSNLTRLIEAYQISYYDPAVSGLFGEINMHMKQYPALISCIEEFERSGGLRVDSQAVPVVIALFSKNNGHAVVPVSVSHNTNGDYEILVYDCNYPDKLQTLTITKDFGKLHYGKYFEASFVNYSTIASIMSDVTLHTDNAEHSLYVSINQENGTITDTQGNGIDEIENAYEQKHINDASTDAFSGIRSFVLPEGNYIVSPTTDTDIETSSQTDENVSFYLASSDTFAEVTTTDESASLSISQTNVENGNLQLSLTAKTTDSTENSSSITLINNQGMERTITVDSNTATLTLTENNTISLEAPADAAVTLDGRAISTTNGKTDISFVEAENENPLKIHNLETDVSCNKTNKLSGNVSFSLISNTSEPKDANVTITYTDSKENTVASYNEDITIVSGLNSVSLDFADLNTAFTADDLEETLTCQVTVKLANTATEANTSVTAETDCTISKYAVITFDTNGGSGTFETQYVAAGEKAAEPENPPTKDEYKFLGWFADGSETAFDFTTAIASNITLTAKWEKVTPPQTEDDDDNGSSTNPPADDSGSSANPPADDSGNSANPPADDSGNSANPPADDSGSSANPPADDSGSSTNPPTNGDSDNTTIPPTGNNNGHTTPSTDDNSNNICTPADFKVTKITITTKSPKIAAGKKVALTATVFPADATNSKLTWTSSNPKWASVNADTGLVTTKKAGKGKTVTITAAATDGSGIKAAVKVKIMKNAVKKITLKAAKKKVTAGKKVKIKATIKTTGKKNVNKTLKWTTSNAKWATVKNGTVTTKKAGKGHKVKITAASTDGTNKKASVTISIK